VLHLSSVCWATQLCTKVTASFDETHMESDIATLVDAIKASAWNPLSRGATKLRVLVVAHARMMGVDFHEIMRTPETGTTTELYMSRATCVHKEMHGKMHLHSCPNRSSLPPFLPPSLPPSTSFSLVSPPAGMCLLLSLCLPLSLHLDL